MKGAVLRSTIPLVLAALVSFGAAGTALAEWSAPAVTHRTSDMAGSPHLLELQDGRTMLTFMKKRYGTNLLYYMISTNGVWSVPILIPSSNLGYDPTVAQSPATGNILVAYAKYDTVASPHKWHASIHVTQITPANLDRYQTSIDDCDGYVEIEPTNFYWSSPTLAVSSGYESLEGLDGYADDIVPSILFVQDASSPKALIVYAHGWEPGKYGAQWQSAQLKVVESRDGNVWSSPRPAYDTPAYYDSKPSCTGIAPQSPAIVCTFYRRDKSTGYSGLFTIRSWDWGYTWSTVPYAVLYESASQHKWPFLLKDKGKIHLAYTTREGSLEGDFGIRWLTSADDGYTWAWNRSISGLLGASETWPALAGRYDYVGPLHGLTAVWDNDPWSGPPEYRVYSSNLLEFQLVSPRGGELWVIGEQRPVAWIESFMPPSTNAAISISRDNGSTWAHIEPSIPNTGSYQWTVTAPATYQAFMKVKLGEYTSANDPAFFIDYSYG